MTHLKFAAASLVAVAIIVTGVAVAQEEAPPVTPDGEPEVERATTFDVEASGGDSLASDQKLGEAQRKIDRMRSVLGSTTDLLEDVRQTDGDIIRLNCINEKLAAMKGFVKVSEQSYSSLRDAASRDDSAAESHHFSLINVSDTRVRELGEEAQLCVGEVQVFVDEVIADRREDPGNADIDPIVPDDDDFDDLFATEPLPELTPFQ